MRSMTKLVAIKYLKEKILNEVKQQFFPSNQRDKTNAEFVKNLREQIENLPRGEMKEKKYFIKNDHSF